MTYEFTLTVRLAATAQEIFDAWLSSDGHTAMTGGVAHASPHVGDAFDAWDGYITGKTVALDPGRRIVQTWQTRHFSPDDADSSIEITLEPDADSTLLTPHHSKVPAGQTSYQESGWRQHYFEPMQRRFDWLHSTAAI
ncbi:MAG: SRPBCC domain-containing protein [Immundisolibacter sp.]|uniref:SRPBCC domain-containing protein n=1 Tax=Immundisolibacter sp. TaxID=1934948 RepID=UPI003EE1B94C